MIIPIDHGNSAIKTVYDEFPTGLISLSAHSKLADDVLEYNGQVYSLALERNIPYKHNKTVDDTFWILTLFAIARDLKRQNNLAGMTAIDLAVCLPPEHYAELLESFQRYFMRNYVNFVYNGVPYSIAIRNVLVYPQCYAAALTNEEQLIAHNEIPLMELDSVFLVDIGGFTTDVLHLVNGNLDMTYCKSLPMGIIPMTNEIATKFSSQLTLRESHIHSVLENRNNILPEDVKQIIKADVEGHAKKTIDRLREMQIDLRSDPVAFISGGAIMLKKFFEADDRIGKAYYIEDTKATAKGLAILARQELAELGA